jgi:hypothetical protein
MKHSFTPSIGNMLACAICKKDSIAHTDQATCDCCPNIGPVEIRYGSMLMCEPCWAKELAAQLANNTPEKQTERVDALNAAIEASRMQDSSIQVRQDIFNAATVSITELQQAIQVDTAINNKPYHLASELVIRFQGLQTKIFAKQQEVNELATQQKAIQVYLNNMANTLRQEERDKLKLQDINYTPSAPKVKVPKVPSIRTKSTTKLDKVELRKYAAELGIPEYNLQMFCVMKGITPESAAKIMRESINAAKAATTTETSIEVK